MALISGADFAVCSFCAQTEEGSRCLSPSSILIPACSPLPLLCLNKDNCSLLATRSVWDLESECVSSLIPVAKIVALLQMCVYEQQRLGEEIILKILLGLVPTRFSVWSISAFFSTFSIEIERVWSWGSCLSKSASPSTFSCLKHSTFLFCCCGCFNLKIYHTFF